MTNEELLKHLLAERLAKDGENAFSTRKLRAQLASLQHFKRAKLAEGSQKFHVRARQVPPEDHQEARPADPGTTCTET
jgi:hypothetical protein